MKDLMLETHRIAGRKACGVDFFNFVALGICSRLKCQWQFMIELYEYGNWKKNIVTDDKSHWGVCQSKVYFIGIEKAAI